MRGYVACLFLLLLLLLSACIKDKYSVNEELVIASVNPMSGASARFGNMKVKAIKLAIAEVNNAGGINGKQVRLIVEDDAGSALEAHKTAEKIADNKDILAVIGHWNSNCTLAARHVYNGAKIPAITDSINKSITDGTTPYLFRISLSDAYQAKQLADYVFYKLKLKHAAIIYVNNDFGQGMKKEFQQYYEGIGGEITTEEEYLEVQKGKFTAELKKIKTSGAELIFVAGYHQEMALFAKQARALELGLPIIGTEAVSSFELIRLGQEAVEGIVFAGYYHPQLMRAGLQQFNKDFIMQYSEEPDHYAALAYDSAKILLQAIRQGGETGHQYITILIN